MTRPNWSAVGNAALIAAAVAFAIPMAGMGVVIAWRAFFALLRLP